MKKYYLFTIALFILHSMESQTLNDLQINYGITSHTPENNVRYGRIPQHQLNDEFFLFVSVENDGLIDQTNVVLSSTFTNGVTSINETSSLDSLLSGDVLNMYTSTNQALSMGLYLGDFSVVSDQETDGELFYNNVLSSQFEITENLYSQDMIGLVENVPTSMIGPGMFIDQFTSEPFYEGALMTLYPAQDQSVLYGVRLLITSSYSNVGSLIYSFLSDSSEVMYYVDGLVSSNLYEISPEDIKNGYIDLMFAEPYIVDGESAYYAGVYIVEGSGFRMKDDVSIIQPDLASLMYVDDQTYTNGNAVAIQLFSVAEMPDDFDNDGVDNVDDAFPYDSTETLDTDNDGIGNNADEDDDGDGCSDEFELDFGTDPLIVDCTVGVDEYEDLSIAIYPNPADGEITMTNLDQIKLITLTDISGKTIAEYKKYKTTLTLELSKIEPGSYFLHFKNAQGKRIVKNIIIL